MLTAPVWSAPRCLTPSLLPTMPAARPVPTAPRLSDAKVTRDPYDVPDAAESDNFIVRWGPTGTVPTAAVEALLGALERAWQVEVIDLAHPAPETTVTTKINVYIGDTEGGAPSAYGSAGYFTPDGDGYPMIVISRDSLNAGESGHLTAAHELYHAVQWGLGTYDYGDSAVGAWYWEATASWIEVEVFPDNSDYAVFLGAYALLPHLPVDFFDYPDTGALEEYHQYGAMILPRYLAEFEADPSIIRDTWVEPAGGTRDPLYAIDAALADHGSDLAAAFSAYAARNATWDYAHQDAYLESVDYWAWAFPEGDGGVADRVVVEVGERSDWRGPDPDRMPGRYGYTVAEIDLQRTGAVSLELDLVGIGSGGSTAEWGVTVVRDHGDAVTYEPLTLHIGLDQHTFDAVLDGEGADTLWLVVAAWSRDRVDGERFAWQYRVSDPDPDAVPEDQPEVGAGVEPADGEAGSPAAACAHRSGGAPLGLALCVGVAVVGRRRAATSAAAR